MAILRDNWIVIGVAVITALALLLWWRVPKWQMRNRIFKSEKERADVEDNFRKTVGQVIGGGAVLAGAFFAYLQFSQQQDTAAIQFRQQQTAASEQFAKQQDTAAKDALRQQETSTKQLLAQQEASENAFKISQALLISNQVSKGFDQLAAEKPATRLGGIYALEGVMNASEQYYQPVLEALCAFVRDGTRTVGVTEPQWIPAIDIQAALTVIGRRKRGPGIVDLFLARIQGANLENADLSGARLGLAFMFGANLYGANLSGAYMPKAILIAAVLGNANLSGADLSDANLDSVLLVNADLSDADLSGANLSGTLGLTPEQLEKACGKPATLPPGLTLDKPCPSRRPVAVKPEQQLQPPQAPPVPGQVPARSYLVFFDSGQSTLTVRARQVIAEAAANSTKVQYTRMEVNGYTDTFGTPQQKQRLSILHARAVATELIKDGVPANAITTQGFGDTHLLVPTGPGVREPQNRRAEVIIR